MLAAGHGAEREAGALFYYLNRTGYNGLCRFNRSGEFNVPFGQYTRIAYTRDFTAVPRGPRRLDVHCRRHGIGAARAR